MDLTNYIYKIFYPNTKKYTFYLIVHGSFSKMDHILGQKILYKFKKIEINLVSYPTTKQHNLKLTAKKKKKISSKYTH